MTAPNVESSTAANPTTSLLDLLRQSAQPLTIAELRQKWSGEAPSEKRLRELLEPLTFQFRVFESRSKGRSPRYWDRDEVQLARERIEELLADQPRTRAELLKELVATLGTGANRGWCEQQLDDLIREGQVKEHPSLQGQTHRLSLRPVNPLDYVSPSILSGLTKVYQKLAKVGVTAEQLTDALRPALRLPDPTAPASEIDDLILKGMADLEPHADDGVPVSVRELRRQMPEAYRGQEFDRAVVRLAAGGRVVLRLATTPEPFTDDERRELVQDGDGALYAFVSKRV